MELCTMEWLPDADQVMARCRAAAAADALLSPDPDLRQFWCKKDWKPGQTLARQTDGAGSYSYIVEAGDTVVIKVCVARASIGPDPLARFQRAPDVEMPPLAIEVLNDPELRHQELSFLAWSQGGNPWEGLNFRVDGVSSTEMGQSQLKVVCQGAKQFYLYAQTYHEVTIDPPALMELFKLKPLDDALARKIAPDSKLTQAREELTEIGFPLA